MATKTVARRALCLRVWRHTATTTILVASCATQAKWQTEHRLAVKYALWERPVQTETALSAMLEHPRAQTELPACRAPVAPLGWVDSASHVLLAQNQTHPCRRVSSVLMALWGRKAPAILNVGLGLHQTRIERRVWHAQLSLARTRRPRGRRRRGARARARRRSECKDNAPQGCRRYPVPGYFC